MPFDMSDLKYRVSAYNQSIDAIQGILEKWKGRGVFSKIAAAISSPSTISEFVDMRTEARKAEVLGKAIKDKIAIALRESDVSTKERQELATADAAVNSHMAFLSKIASTSDFKAFFDAYGIWLGAFMMVFGAVLNITMLRMVIR